MTGCVTGMKISMTAGDRGSRYPDPLGRETGQIVSRSEKFAGPVEKFSTTFFVTCLPGTFRNAPMARVGDSGLDPT